MLFSKALATALISRLLLQMMLENVFAPLLATGATPYLMVRPHPLRAAASLDTRYPSWACFSGCLAMHYCCRL